MNVKIDSIKLTIGKKEVELPIEDAKTLWTELGKLFSKDVIYMPTYIEREKHWPWTITSTGSDSITLTGGTNGNENVSCIKL